VEPPLAEYPGGHLAACHHPRNVSQAEISAAARSPLSPLSAGQLMPGQRAPASGAEESQVAARAGGTADAPDEEP
jgi:hypothetical protein